MTETAETVSGLLLLLIVGFVVGMGVLLAQEHPQITEFVDRRPVVGWMGLFLIGGAVSYLLALIMLFLLLMLLNFFTR